MTRDEKGGGAPGPLPCAATPPPLPWSVLDLVLQGLSLPAIDLGCRSELDVRDLAEIGFNQATKDAQHFTHLAAGNEAGPSPRDAVVDDLAKGLDPVDELGRPGHQKQVAGEGRRNPIGQTGNRALGGRDHGDTPGTTSGSKVFDSR